MENRIKAVRKALKLSQRKFGEKLGVSRDVISNIEYGRVKPKDLLLHHMCQVYGVSEHWLETGEGEMFNDDPNEVNGFEEALTIFQSLCPDFQNYALKQIKKLTELHDKN